MWPVARRHRLRITTTRTEHQVGGPDLHILVMELNDLSNVHLLVATTRVAFALLPCRSNQVVHASD